MLLFGHNQEIIYRRGCQISPKKLSPFLHIHIHLITVRYLNQKCKYKEFSKNASLHDNEQESASSVFYVVAFFYYTRFCCPFCLLYRPCKRLPTCVNGPTVSRAKIFFASPVHLNQRHSDLILGIHVAYN